MVTTTLRLVCQTGQERRNGRDGIGLRLKTGELRMTPITARAASQDFLGEQRFPPGGDQSLRVEIPWMQSP